MGVGVIPAAKRDRTSSLNRTARYGIRGRVMGPACVAAGREPFVHPDRVLNTMAEARAPSTRRLYALKWPIFSTWWQNCDLEPVTSDLRYSSTLGLTNRTKGPEGTPV